MKHLFKFVILMNFFFIFNVKAVCTYNFKLSDITCSFIYDYTKEDNATEFKCYDANENALNYERDNYYRFNYNGNDYTIKYDASGFFSSDGLGTQMINAEKCLPITYKFENANITNPNDKEIIIGSDYDKSLSAGSTVTLIEASPTPTPTSTPTPSNPSYNPYDEIERCEGAAAIDGIPSCWCMPAAVADITSFIYKFLQIGGPVLLIILGAIDLGKAIVATDESGIQKAKKKLVNKFVAAACIFLVFAVIQMIVNIVGGNDYVQQVEGNCLYYLLNGYSS